MKTTRRSTDVWLMRLAGVLLFLFIPILQTVAEDYSFNRYGYKTEVFGVVGTGSWDYDDSALLLGGGVVYRAYPKAGFEVAYRHMNNERNYTFPEGNQGNKETANILTASVHYYFSEQRYQPYLLLGGGLIANRRSGFFNSPEQDYTFDYDHRSFVLEAGGGVDLFITNKLSVRPDVRLLIGQNGSAQGNINFCYHW